MDAEGLGGKLLLTHLVTPAEPLKSRPWVGTVTASHRTLTLKALSSSLNAGTAKRGCLGRVEALGCLLAICPQNGHAHLHIIDFSETLRPKNKNSLTQQRWQKEHVTDVFGGGQGQRGRCRSPASLDTVPVFWARSIYQLTPRSHFLSRS